MKFPPPSPPFLLPSVVVRRIERFSGYLNARTIQILILAISARATILIPAISAGAEILLPTIRAGAEILISAISAGAQILIATISDGADKLIPVIRAGADTNSCKELELRYYFLQSELELIANFNILMNIQSRHWCIR